MGGEILGVVLGLVVEVVLWFHHGCNEFRPRLVVLMEMLGVKGG